MGDFGRGLGETLRTFLFSGTLLFGFIGKGSIWVVFSLLGYSDPGG